MSRVPKDQRYALSFKKIFDLIIIIYCLFTCMSCEHLPTSEVVNIQIKSLKHELKIFRSNSSKYLRSKVFS